MQSAMSYEDAWSAYLRETLRRTSTYDIRATESSGKPVSYPALSKLMYGVGAVNRVCKPVEFELHCRPSAAVAIENRVRDL